MSLQLRVNLLVVFMNEWSVYADAQRLGIAAGGILL